MQETIHEDCTELIAFVCEYLTVRLHNPLSQETVCCIHHSHRKHEQDQLLLGPLLYIFSGTVVQVSPFFASVYLQIKLNTMKLQNIQSNTFVTMNQEPKSIFAIFLYLKL